MGRKPTGKPPGRPRETAKVAEALGRAKATGESLEDAARAVGVAPSTVHAHKAKGAGKAGAASAPTPAPSKPPVSPSSQALPQGPAIPADKLADLASLCARLPLRQQDVLLAALPLDALRGQALARGLAGHPSAALAVARELRGVPV